MLSWKDGKERSAASHHVRATEVFLAHVRVKHTTRPATGLHGRSERCCACSTALRGVRSVSGSNRSGNRRSRRKYACRCLFRQQEDRIGADFKETLKQIERSSGNPVAITAHRREDKFGGVTNS